MRNTDDSPADDEALDELEAEVEALIELAL